MNTSKILYRSSNKGTNKIITDCSKFEYMKNQSTATSTYYICTRRPSMGCLATAIVRQNFPDTCILKGDHCHQPDPDGVKIRQLIKSQVKIHSTSSVCPRNVVADILTKTEESKKPRLPTTQTMKRRLHRERHKALNYPPVPKNIVEELSVLPESLAKLDSGEEFVLMNQIVSKSRMLLFMAPESTLLLKNCSTLLMDGTFQTAPSGFSQIYIVFCKDSVDCTPVLFGLLPSKETEVYVLMLNALKEAIEGDYKFRSVVIDYEKSMIEALDAVFEDVDIDGCYFHFKQAIWRQIRAKGCACLYSESDDFRKLVNNIYLLAFVPPSDVQFHFYREVWKKLATLPSCGQDFLKYVRKTWIGQRGKFPPRFCIDIWSMWDRTNGDGESATTNAYLESFNRSWNLSLGRKPNMWKVLSGFKREYELHKARRREQLAGVYVPTNPGRKNRIERLHAQRKNLMQSYKKKKFAEFAEAMKFKI